MKLIRFILLLLLTLTVPVSGFGLPSQSMPANTHHARVMADMAGIDHSQMSHGELPESAGAGHNSGSCESACLCDGQCFSGGCSAAPILIGNALAMSSLQANRQTAQATTPYVLVAYRLDLLRPPITVAL